MTSARALALSIPRNIWRWIRQVSGDAAYENYLHSMQRVADVARIAARTTQAGCCTTQSPPPTAKPQ